MCPAALPVQSRSRESRERMLRAAVTCLVDLGYAATTTTAIQEVAEVSRGSLLHQFPAKDDLLVAAVRHLALQRRQAVELLHAGEGGDPAVRVDRAIDVLWQTFTEPQFTAAVELWVAARHNPGLAAPLTASEHEVGDATKEMLAALFGPAVAAHPEFGTFLTLLLAGMRGVVLTYFFDARDPATDPHLPLWKQMARRYLLDAPPETPRAGAGPAPRAAGARRHARRPAGGSSR